METKLTKAIHKLNRLTKEGKITWEKARWEPDSITGTDRLSGNAYITEFNDQQFRIYRFETRHYTDYDEYLLSEGFTLEFIDEKGKGGSKFPEDSSIVDLYETVLYKTSNVDGFLDSFLDDTD